MQKIKNISNGFTLAEVLITLAVIGVVAALTIPTVVRNYQKTQTITQLKKVYSALSNTTNLAIADEGPISGWEIGENGTGEAAVDFGNRYLIPYLKVSKNCENKTTSDCAFNYSYLNSGTQNHFSNAYSRFYLNDGTLIALRIANTINEEGRSYRQVHIQIDINGQKKPNKYGRDIFFFKYYIYHGWDSSTYSGKLLPYYYNDTRDLLTGKTGITDSCSWEGSGAVCAALIMKDGWTMADDYPW